MKKAKTVMPEAPGIAPDPLARAKANYLAAEGPARLDALRRRIALIRERAGAIATEVPAPVLVPEPVMPDLPPPPKAKLRTVDLDNLALLLAPDPEEEPAGGPAPDPVPEDPEPEYPAPEQPAPPKKPRAKARAKAAG